VKISRLKVNFAQRRSTDAVLCGDALTLISDIEEGVMHPAMFPASLCEKPIRTFSREGDLVFDPFCGSGTTLVAAQRVGRGFIGFDVNPKYAEIARERLARESSERQGRTPDVPSLQWSFDSEAIFLSGLVCVEHSCYKRDSLSQMFGSSASSLTARCIRQSISDQRSCR